MKYRITEEEGAGRTGGSETCRSIFETAAAAATGAAAGTAEADRTVEAQKGCER